MHDKTVLGAQEHVFLILYDKCMFMGGYRFKNELCYKASKPSKFKIKSFLLFICFS